MTERLAHAANTIFTDSYVFNYERVSASSSRPYEQNAMVLAGLSGEIRNGQCVLEVGCGTGNSTIVFTESIPQDGKLIAVEPSPAFLKLAQYKFGKTRATLPSDLDVETRDFIESQRERARLFSEKVDFVLARADGLFLPVKDKSVDIIFAASVMHWLAFESFESRDIDYLNGAIADFARVLRSGGKLIFDSSGLQFDFGDDKVNERLVNSYHLLSHPFHMKFLEKLSDDLRARGLPADKLTEFSSIDKMYHVFDLAFIRSKLAEFGMEQVPFSEERSYHLRIETLPLETIMERVVGGARMRCFNSPDLKQLPEEIMDEIVIRAYEKAVADYDPKIADEGAELMAAFVFVKK